MAARNRQAPARGPPPHALPRWNARCALAFKSTMGRPRALSNRQVRKILAAHDRYVAWKAMRRLVKSQRQLAVEYGVSPATIALAIRSRGRYKQASPERRAAELRRRGRLFARLRAKDL